MTVFKPRSRMISVRLSEEEYSALKRVCLATGVRSVSDLARDAMETVLRGLDPGTSHVPQADDLRAQIQNIGQRIDQLAAEFSALKAEVRYGPGSAEN